MATCVACLCIAPLWGGSQMAQWCRMMCAAIARRRSSTPAWLASEPSAFQSPAALRAAHRRGYGDGLGAQKPQPPSESTSSAPPPPQPGGAAPNVIDGFGALFKPRPAHMARLDERWDWIAFQVLLALIPPSLLALTMVWARRDLDDKLARFGPPKRRAGHLGGDGAGNVPSSSAATEAAASAAAAAVAAAERSEQRERDLVRRLAGLEADLARIRASLAATDVTTGKTAAPKAAVVGKGPRVGEKSGGVG